MEIGNSSRFPVACLITDIALQFRVVITDQVAIKTVPVIGAAPCVRIGRFDHESKIIVFGFFVFPFIRLHPEI